MTSNNLTNQAKQTEKVSIKSFRDFIHEETSGWNRTELAWLIGGVTVISLLTIMKLNPDNNRLFTTEFLVSLTAAVTGCIAAILTGKGKLGAFVFGLINSVLYAYISYKYKYYGEVCVKVIIFIPLNIYGIFCWIRNISTKDYEVVKRSLGINNIILVTTTVIIATLITGYILEQIGGKRPYIDATTSILATTGLILTIKRYSQNWLLWILLNILSIWLWIIPFYKGEGQPVAILLMWCFYLINSIVMYIRWNKKSYKLSNNKT